VRDELPTGTVTFLFIDRGEPKLMRRVISLDARHVSRRAE